MADSGRAEWGFLVIWEFTVCEGQESAFQQTYGPDGEWARLFRGDSSYIGTELMRDWKEKRKYLTLDYWISQEAYEVFRKRYVAAYEAIDTRCEAMTESEREIGRYVTVSG